MSESESEAPSASLEVKLLEEMFVGQIKKNRLDIHQDMVFIDYRAILNTYNLSSRQIARFSERVFGLPEGSTTFDVYEYKMITGSLVVRGPSVNNLIGLHDDREINEPFLRAATLAGARIMIIDALNLILEQPVIDAELPSIISQHYSTGTISLDDL